MPALYRDYRPRTFGEVIDQDHIKKALQNSVAKDFFGHAYLFTGASGTGKTSVARIFARAINCLKQKDGEPCNECEACKPFLSGTALDLVEIDAASNTGVENIREIIEHLKFSPSSAKYKVFIIDEAHMLSKGAFNALLKTLEEPPKHAVFILATTEVHKVPATIISRTQRFDFRKISHQSIAEHLKTISKKEKIDIDEASLELIAAAAEGSVRDSLSLLDKLSSFGKINTEQAEKILGLTNLSTSQKLLDLIVAKDAKGSLEFLEEIFSQGTDPVQFNRDLLEYLRKVLMHSMGADIAYAIDEKQKKILEQHSKEIGAARLLHIIRLFLRANKDFQNSPSLDLPVQIAAAESCLSPSPVSQAPASQPSAKPEQPSAEKFSFKSPKQQEQEPKKESKRNFKPVSMEQLLSEWPLIMQELKDRASTLFAVMKSGTVKGIEDNKITLCFTYKFHKDSLDNAKNSEILISVLQDHFKTSFWLEVICEKPEQPEDLDAENIAMEIFGGEPAV